MKGFSREVIVKRWKKLSAAFTLLILLSAKIAARDEKAPFEYEPSLARRISYSAVVCSATIVRTQKFPTNKVIGGAERNQYIAEAIVDKVFKGTLGSPTIAFRYYDFSTNPTAEYFGPPAAHFEKESRYLVFLSDTGQDLEVSVPVWQMEIALAPTSQSDLASLASSTSGIADELFYSIRTKPKTIGRTASHYFSWAEELIGKDDAVHGVEPFLDSDDDLVKYQAAWWLSFRRLSDSVINILENTKNNPTIEEWARSGAGQRLEDIHHGNRVQSPK
jgi:hypothetical protein